MNQLHAERYKLLLIDTNFCDDIYIIMRLGCIKGELMMDHKMLEDKIIENYRQEENMMILVFAQWCINNELDPEAIYLRAHPDQGSNPALREALELTVPKAEAGEIADETLLGVLSLFGNDDLAFVVNEEMNKRQR